MSALTASEEVLKAAAILKKKGKSEFTEWELTVEAWKLNSIRWGLKGYENEYPDHKRVMNEIMAKGSQKAVGRGWLIRTRPNHYQITNSGITKASSIENINISNKEKNRAVYDSVLPYIKNQVFQKHCVDEKEPKTWLGAAAFLGLTKNEPDLLERKFTDILSSANSALDWLEEKDQEILRRDDSARPFTKQQLKKLLNFTAILKTRFKPQLDAIMAKRS